MISIIHILNLEYCSAGFVRKLTMKQLTFQSSLQKDVIQAASVFVTTTCMTNIDLVHF